MKRLELLDYGRFFAALCVVLFHYTYDGIENGKITSISLNEELSEITKYGYFGVQLFFMISGYVIFYSARNRTASQFAVSRAARLYPLFWFAVLITSFFALAWGGPKMAVTPSQVLANLTMMPRFLGYDLVDGVYWTLALELKFYILVFIFILLGLQHKLETAFLLWPWLIIGSLLAGFDSLPFVGQFYCFFAAGAIFAIIKEKLTVQAVLSLTAAYALCVYDSAIQPAALNNSREYSGLVIALLVTSFFVFFLILNSKWGSNLRLFKSSELGTLTYPLYLIHSHIGYIVISKLATEQNKLLVCSLVFLAAIGVSYFLHKVIEVKYASYFTELFRSTIGKTAGLLQQQSLYLQAAMRKKLL
ncbi:acyltransferase family protein [Pontibacter sp. H249]|uniref:acyltransferase family protein n=1 Tax=Pontibacter sp. H249 TaxID=3133420 RepID=UPI0030BA85AA